VNLNVQAIALEMSVLWIGRPKPMPANKDVKRYGVAVHAKPGNFIRLAACRLGCRS